MNKEIINNYDKDSFKVKHLCNTCKIKFVIFKEGYALALLNTEEKIKDFFLAFDMSTTPTIDGKYNKELDNAFGEMLQSLKKQLLASISEVGDKK